MRSGIPDLPSRRHFYPAELASSATEVFGKLPDPEVPPGSETNYTTTNYVLLGTIIEHATGRPLAKVLRSDVLDHPGLEGIAYTVEDALAGDGWGVKSTSASLAPVPLCPETSMMRLPFATQVLIRLLMHRSRRRAVECTRCQYSSLNVLVSGTLLRSMHPLPRPRGGCQGEGRQFKSGLGRPRSASISSPRRVLNPGAP
jgi:CubicO group peptidase (beta-lactamase class C family)